MTARERFHAVMGFRPFDRLPVVEWAPWWRDATIARWYDEGLPRELTEQEEISRHFGLDLYLLEWLRARGPDCPQAESHGAPIISSMDEYEALLPHLYPKPGFDPERWAYKAELQERGEAVLWGALPGFFWYPRILLGIEQHLLAFYDQPELMHRINQDLAEWSARLVEQLVQVCTPDYMTFAEDMSYNHGPMLSKRLFDEFMLPYYRQVVPVLRKHGILPIIDSDGDITEAAPWFQEAGLAGVVPLERQAGVDVAVLRDRHPRMRFIGCFDKMTMDKGEGRMRAEFERLLPVAAGGGLVVSCDHQTPPGVSYADYELYLRLFGEYAQRAGEMSRTLLPNEIAAPEDP